MSLVLAVAPVLIAVSVVCCAGTVCEAAAVGGQSLSAVTKT